MRTPPKGRERTSVEEVGVAAVLREPVRDARKSAGRWTPPPAEWRGTPSVGERSNPGAARDRGKRTVDPVELPAARAAGMDRRRIPPCPSRRRGCSARRPTASPATRPAAASTSPLISGRPALAPAAPPRRQLLRRSSPRVPHNSEGGGSAFGGVLVVGDEITYREGSTESLTRQKHAFEAARCRGCPAAVVRYYQRRWTGIRRR